MNVIALNNSLEARVAQLEATVATLSAQQHPQADSVASLNDAALFLRCSYLTVLRAVKDGRLPSYRLGRRVLVKRSDLENYALGTPRKVRTKNEIQSEALRRAAAN